MDRKIMIRIVFLLVALVIVWLAASQMLDTESRGNFILF